MSDLFDNNYSGGSSQPITTLTLSGEIIKVLFESEDKAFAIIKISDIQGVEHTVTGDFLGVYEGQGIEVTGNWIVHKEYGKQFKANTFKCVLPVSEEGIIKYLGSGVIRGVGPKLAEQIVGHFGASTLDIIENFSKRLTEINGFGKKKLEMVRDSWNEQAEQRNMTMFLQGLAITPAYCKKLYKIYGETTADVVRDNPYQLAEEVKGIGFLMADKVAAKLGIEKNSPMRIRAGIIYSLNQLSMLGHVCYPENEFIKYATDLLSVTEQEVIIGIQAAQTAGFVTCESFTNEQGITKSFLYSKTLYIAEKVSASIIDFLSKQPSVFAEQYYNIPIDSQISFSDEQLYAINCVGNNSLNIITGGPGVGKTTVIGEIVRKAMMAQMKVMLAAPTGRAAKRLSESSALTAKTIHRLLKWEPETGGFFHGKKHPLNCDMLIIDEVSMLDMQLAYNLLNAIKPGTILVLVGDMDQLPSVGPGRVLKDFIYSKRFAVTHLTKIYRQGNDSKIITNAHAVNKGNLPQQVNLPKDCLTDFYWIEQEDPSLVVNTILEMVKNRIPKRFSFSPLTDIQVLTPMNRGECGTLNLNKVLQESLNGGQKPRVKSGEKSFKAGDRVMQISNNYDKHIYNGDMGRIININSKDEQFTVLFEQKPVVYEFMECEQLVHSYAITIHKSQGSEFPVVIIPMLSQHYMMLQRNLLYTAMTRAKKLLILIGSKKAISMAVNNIRLAPRYSMLCRRLMK